MTASTDVRLIRLFMVALGFGASFVFVPSQTFSMATIEKARTGRASATFEGGKQVGSAVGAALLSTIMTATGAMHGAGLLGFHVAFLAAGVIALLAVTVATATERRRSTTAQT